MRRAVLWGIFALLALLGAGCVAPPDSGPIRIGATGPAADRQEPFVRPIAKPPVPGMEPEEVVAGFLAACAAIEDDFQVARRYLTPWAAGDWHPGAGVVIAEDQPNLVSRGASVEAGFSVVGEVSSSGALTEVPPSTRSLVYPLERVAGEWRIAQAPPGLLLTRSAFDRAFAFGSAFFIDPTGRWTVPDGRVVPRIGNEALATALVNALLDGPSPWLAASVRTAVPSGLQLALGAVPVSDGLARIELTGPQPVLGDQALAELGAQLAWTLRQVQGIDSFEVFVDGRRLPLPGNGPVPLVAYSGFNPDVLPEGSPLYAVTEAGVPVELVDEEPPKVFDIATPAADGEAPTASRIALSPLGSLVAAVSIDGGSISVGLRGRPVAAVRQLPGPIGSGPSVDGRGRIWWTGPAGEVRVAAASQDGSYQTLTVPVDGLAEPVLAVRPSRDGARAVVVAGAERRAYLAAVVEGSGGTRLTGPTPLQSGGPVADAAWRSASVLTLLVPGDEAVRRLDLLGNEVATFSAPGTATSVSDAPGAALVLGFPDGSAGPLTGSGVRLLPGVRFPAYPG